MCDLMRIFTGLQNIVKCLLKHMHCIMHMPLDFGNFLWKNTEWNLFFLSQPIGFEFSESEPSALVQRQGGPCAVIAPVQAFLLKTILSETDSQNLSSVSNKLIYSIY